LPNRLRRTNKKVYHLLSGDLGKGVGDAPLNFELGEERVRPNRIRFAKLESRLDHFISLSEEDLLKGEY
jgi:hypothetical protein